jgi:hypothetical protein
MRRKSSWPRGGAFDFENKNTEVWQGESESPARSSRQSLCSCLHNVAPDSITAYPRWCGQDCENGDCTLVHCCESNRHWQITVAIVHCGLEDMQAGIGVDTCNPIAWSEAITTDRKGVRDADAG